MGKEKRASPIHKHRSYVDRIHQQVEASLIFGPYTTRQSIWRVVDELDGLGIVLDLGRRTSD